MKVSVHLRTIAAQFDRAAQNGAFEWDEEAAERHAAVALESLDRLLSASDARVGRWLKLSLAGVEEQRFRLGREGYDAARRVCNLLAEECERLNLQQEV